MSGAKDSNLVKVKELVQSKFYEQEHKYINFACLMHMNKKQYNHRFLHVLNMKIKL